MSTKPEPRECPDGGTCHHGCTREGHCARRDDLGCLPLSASGLDDNWNPPAQAERAAAQEPRCTYPDCSCDGPGDDGGCGMTAPAQAEPQPTANAHAFSPSESDRHLLFAHTPTRYAGDYPWYLNLTMLRMRGDVVLTVRLPTSHGKPPGETGSVRLTREMWRTLVAAIGDADVVFKATDELDAML